MDHNEQPCKAGSSSRDRSVKSSGNYAERSGEPPQAHRCGMGERPQAAVSRAEDYISSHYGPSEPAQPIEQPQGRARQTSGQTQDRNRRTPQTQGPRRLEKDGPAQTTARRPSQQGPGTPSSIVDSQEPERKTSASSEEWDLFEPINSVFRSLTVLHFSDRLY
jgi:hypothetical protein